MVRCFLTTFDNPYSPYDEFEKWYQYDVEHGYNSSGLLMRIAETSSQFTDFDISPEGKLIFGL